MAPLGDLLRDMEDYLQDAADGLRDPVRAHRLLMDLEEFKRLAGIEFDGDPSVTTE